MQAKQYSQYPDAHLQHVTNLANEVYQQRTLCFFDISPSTSAPHFPPLPSVGFCHSPHPDHPPPLLVLLLPQPLPPLQFLIHLRSGLLPLPGLPMDPFVQHPNPTELALMFAVPSHLSHSSPFPAPLPLLPLALPPSGTSTPPPPHLHHGSGCRLPLPCLDCCRSIVLPCLPAPSL